MFTGIVAAVGRIERVEPRDKGVRLLIDAGGLDMRDVGLGDSIAVNGVCLTVVTLEGRRFAVDVSQETIDCTIGLGAPGEVNLEKSLTLADRLGGHLVSGHVDGVGEVVRFEPVGESWLLSIRAPQALAKYIARKGSIAVQGVSLTVNRVEGAEFDINLIPHTVAVTTLKHLARGAKVNLEVDLIARYAERMLSESSRDASGARPIQRFMVPGQAKPFSHYCHVVRAGPHVYVSGAVGIREDGSIPGDTVEQFRVALANVDACLRHCGAGPEHVLKVNIYLTDIAERAAINPLRIEYFGEHRPASTLVEVARLVDPRLTVEIEAVAYAGAGPGEARGDSHADGATPVIQRPSGRAVPRQKKRPRGGAAKTTD